MKVQYETSYARDDIEDEFNCWFQGKIFSKGIESQVKKLSKCVAMLMQEHLAQNPNDIKELAETLKDSDDWHSEYGHKIVQGDN